LDLRFRGNAEATLFFGDTPFARVTVPNHKALRVRTLRTILHEAQLTVEQPIELLNPCPSLC